MSTPTPPPSGGGNAGGQPPVPPPPPGGGAPVPPPPPPVGGAPGGGSQQGNNGLAIASLVVGLVSYLCCAFGFVPGAAAIILGVVAKNQIKQTGQNGNGMATAGIVLGAIAAVLGIVWLIFSLVSGSGNYYYYGR